MAVVKKLLVFVVGLALLVGIVFFLIKSGTISGLKNKAEQNPNKVQSTVTPGTEPLSGKQNSGHLQRTGMDPIDIKKNKK